MGLIGKRFTVQLFPNLFQDQVYEWRAETLQYLTYIIFVDFVPCVTDQGKLDRMMVLSIFHFSFFS